MARVYYVNKSRKPRRCHKGHEIPTGSRYAYSAPGFRGREIYACSEHPFKQSDLMTGLAQAPQMAREAFLEEVQGIDTSARESALETLEEAVDTLRSAVEDYVYEREASLEAWENGNYQLEELRDTAQAALDEVENFSIDEFDQEEPEEVDEPGEEPEEDGTPEALEAIKEWMNQDEAHALYQEELEAWEEAWQEHVEEQIEAAVDMVESLEF